MLYNLIEEMEEYAKNNNIPIMQKEGIDFLCNYINDNNIKSILEIGSAIGYSAIKMASINDDIKVTTIEIDEDRYNLAINNINKANLDSRINIILGDARETIIKDKFDLIFIDAAKGQYIKFFEKYKNNLNKKGVIISDNLLFHGLVEEKERIKNKNLRQLVNKIKKYIGFLKNNEEFDTVFYRLGDGVAVTCFKED